MSADDQHAAIGRSVEEYGRVRKELAAAESECARHGEFLETLGHHLRKAEAPNLLAAPKLDDVKRLVEDVSRLRLRKTELRAQLSDMGVPLQD